MTKTLRTTLEEAFEDSVQIDYNEGIITAGCEFFPEFKTLKMTLGSDKVYADNAEYTIGNIFTINGSTYVNSSLFSDVFGWEMTYAHKDILNNSYSYSFDTNQY